jgi:hypothetical protein
MYLLKQCAKCRGDLAIGSDQYGPYISCMQCGRYQDIEIREASPPEVRRGPVQPSPTPVSEREGYRTTIPRFSTGRGPAAISA